MGKRSEPRMDKDAERQSSGRTPENSPPIYYRWVSDRNWNKLAADNCQHYDSRHGSSLNGPSRTKIEKNVRFMFTFEALKGGQP